MSVRAFHFVGEVHSPKKAYLVLKVLARAERMMVELLVEGLGEGWPLISEGLRLD
jgi:hypothetical protein